MIARLRRHVHLGMAALLLLTTSTVSACTMSDDGVPTTATPTTSRPWVANTPQNPPISSGGVPTADGALGAKWNWNLYQQAKPYLPKLAGGSTYYEVVWCDVESAPGQADWHRTDRVVQLAREAGVMTLIKIRVGRCWATDGTVKHARGQKNITESAMPKDLSAYASFVERVVQRYSPYGATEYAVENEVNSTGFWDGTPEDYTRLVRTAAAAIHIASPKATVVDSGISSVASGYGVVDRLLQAGKAKEAVDVYNRYYARRFNTRGDEIVEVHDEPQLRQVLDAEPARRALAYLAATNDLVAQHIVAVRQVHFYEQWSVLPYLLDYLQANTPNDIPLEMWELGSFQRDSTLTPEERTAEVVKATALALGSGVRKVVWLPLIAQSDGRVSYQLYGLLSESGEPQPSAEAFGAMAAAARGAKAMVVDRDGLTGVGFEKGGDSTLFIWSNGPPVEVKVAQRATVSKVTAATSAGEPTVGSGSQVEVGSEPIRLTVPTTVREFQGSLK